MTKSAQRKTQGETVSAKVFCITCGKLIGRAVPGNIAACYCDNCSNEYTLDFREVSDSMKHENYRLAK